jgi:hypothetical protein
VISCYWHHHLVCEEEQTEEKRGKLSIVKWNGMDNRADNAGMKDVTKASPGKNERQQGKGRR